MLVSSRGFPKLFLTALESEFSPCDGKNSDSVTSAAGSSVPSAVIKGLHFGDTVWIGVGGFSYDGLNSGINGTYTIRADIDIDSSALVNRRDAYIPLPVHRLLVGIPQV